MPSSQELREGVWQAYTDVALRPDAENRFRVGRAFAEGLGYPPGWLNRLPPQSVGPAGAVFGFDFSWAMLARACQGARETGLRQAHFGQAAAEHLPLPNQSIDTALVNGLLNLNPARAEIFQELARVVRPGGTVFAAELILIEGESAQAAVTLDDWFS